MSPLTVNVLGLRRVLTLVLLIALFTGFYTLLFSSLSNKVVVRDVTTETVYSTVTVTGVFCEEYARAVKFMTLVDGSISAYVYGYDETLLINTLNMLNREIDEIRGQNVSDVYVFILVDFVDVLEKISLLDFDDAYVSYMRAVSNVQFLGISRGCIH